MENPEIDRPKDGLPVIDAKELAGLVTKLKFPDDPGKDAPPEQRQPFEDGEFFVKICQQTSHSPLPPSYSPELGRLHSLLMGQISKIRVLAQDLIPEKELDADLFKKAITKFLNAYRDILKAYEQRRASDCTGIVDDLMKKGAVAAEHRDTVEKVVTGYHPVPPPDVGDAALRGTYADLQKMYAKLWTQAHDLKDGDKTFAPAIVEYGKKRADYENDCRKIVVPVFLKAVGESNKDLKDGDKITLTETEWSETFDEMNELVPTPIEDKEYPVPVLQYLRSQYVWLCGVQRELREDVRAIMTDLRSDRVVDPIRYRNLLKSVAAYLIFLDEYKQSMKLARKKDAESTRLLKLAGFAVALDAANKGLRTLRPPVAPAELKIPLEKLKEYKAAYDKLMGEFAKRPGMDMKKFPSFAEMVKMESKGMLGEFADGIFKLNAIDYLLFAFILYFSKDKTKAASEFLGCILTVAAVNAAALPLEKMAARAAMRGSPAALKFAKLKGPPVLKFAVIVLALFGAAKIIESASEEISDWIPHGPIRKWVEDFLTTLGGGPVFDIGGELVYEVFGVEPKDDGASLAYLMEKKAQPVAPKLCHSIKGWNERVEKNIRRVNPEKRDPYRLQKIDLEPGGDWRKSEWVARQAARTFSLKTFLEHNQLDLKNWIDQCKLAGITSDDVPDLADFVTSMEVPMGDSWDNGVTIDERVLRARDDRFGGWKGNKDFPKFYDRCVKIRDFQNKIEEKGNDKMKKMWKALVKNAADFGEQISCFRYLGIYDPDEWYGNDLAFVRKGMLDEIAHRHRKRDARDIVVYRRFPPPWQWHLIDWDADIIQTFPPPRGAETRPVTRFDKDQKRPAPKDAVSGKENDGGSNGIDGGDGSGNGDGKADAAKFISDLPKDQRPGALDKEKGFGVDGHLIRVGPLEKERDTRKLRDVPELRQKLEMVGCKNLHPEMPISGARHLLTASIVGRHMERPPSTPRRSDGIEKRFEHAPPPYVFADVPGIHLAKVADMPPQFQRSQLLGIFYEREDLGTGHTAEHLILMFGDGKSKEGISVIQMGDVLQNGKFDKDHWDGFGLFSTGAKFSQMQQPRKDWVNKLWETIELDRAGFAKNRDAAKDQKELVILNTAEGGKHPITARDPARKDTKEEALAADKRAEAREMRRAGLDPNKKNGGLEAGEGDGMKGVGGAVEKTEPKKGMEGGEDKKPEKKENPDALPGGLPPLPPEKEPEKKEDKEWTPDDWEKHMQSRLNDLKSRKVTDRFELDKKLLTIEHRNYQAYYSGEGKWKDAVITRLSPGGKRQQLDDLEEKRSPLPKGVERGGKIIGRDIGALNAPYEAGAVFLLWVPGMKDKFTIITLSNLAQLKDKKFATLRKMVALPSAYGGETFDNLINGCQYYVPKDRNKPDCNDELKSLIEAKYKDVLDHPKFLEELANVLIDDPAVDSKITPESIPVIMRHLGKFEYKK